MFKLAQEIVRFLLFLCLACGTGYSQGKWGSWAETPFYFKAPLLFQFSILLIDELYQIYNLLWAKP